MPRQIPSLTLSDAGGVPLKIGNAVVGALGASGGTVDQDLRVAKAAVCAFDARN